MRLTKTVKKGRGIIYANPYLLNVLKEIIATEVRLNGTKDTILNITFHIANRLGGKRAAVSNAERLRKLWSQKTYYIKEVDLDILASIPHIICVFKSWRQLTDALRDHRSEDVDKIPPDKYHSSPDAFHCIIENAAKEKASQLMLEYIWRFVPFMKESEVEQFKVMTWKEGHFVRSRPLRTFPEIPATPSGPLRMVFIYLDTWVPIRWEAGLSAPNTFIRIVPHKEKEGIEVFPFSSSRS